MPTEENQICPTCHKDFQVCKCDNETSFSPIESRCEHLHTKRMHEGCDPGSGGGTGPVLVCEDCGEVV